MSFGAGNFKEGTEKEKERAGKESVKEAGKWELGPREGDAEQRGSWMEKYDIVKPEHANSLPRIGGRWQVGRTVKKIKDNLLYVKIYKQILYETKGRE